MTDAKSTFRKRRKSGDEGDVRIPRDMAEWFAGKRLPEPSGWLTTPWCAILPPERNLLLGRWQLWKKDHPGAVPPEGFEHLDDPDDDRNAPWGAPGTSTKWFEDRERRRTAAAAAEARKVVRKVSAKAR